MQGRLFNSAGGWIMSFKSPIDGSATMLPLHPKDDKMNGSYNMDLHMKEGGLMEFDIVEEISKDGRTATKYAKLIIQEESTEETSPQVSDDFQIGPNGAYEHKGWDEIFATWTSSKVYSKTVDGLQEFLEKNYLSPDKK